MKIISLWYIAVYLVTGGIGFAFLPDFTFRLFLSNGNYGDVMPRAMGMFMIMLGGLVGRMASKRDDRYFGYTILARIFAVSLIAYLLVKSGDPMFIFVLAIVLIGLLPSMYFAYRDRNTN
jgi:uncharacterized membrane protein YoaK (UPF0700 family)